MEKDLQQIAGLPHVGGAFVCDNAGEVVASSNPPVLASAAMSGLAREAARTLSALEAGGFAATRLEFRYNSWRLIARDLGDGLLVVVCQPGADGALLRMTADVAIAAWRKDARQMKRLAQRRRERSALLSATGMDDASWRIWSQLKLSA